MKKSFLANKQQMGVAALIMGMSILISRFMGLIRDKVISWQFGASGETDLYFTAFVLPDFLNYLLAGGYISITLIPLLSKLFSQNDEHKARHSDLVSFGGVTPPKPRCRQFFVNIVYKKLKSLGFPKGLLPLGGEFEGKILSNRNREKGKVGSEVENSYFDTQEHEDAWRFFGTIFTWATVSIGLLSCIAWLFARDIVPYLAPGFSENQLDRLAYFLRIILPAQVCFLPGACLCALLYVRKQFLVPALIPLIYNGFILGCGVLFPYIGLSTGMDGFCYGVLFGAFFGSFFLPYLAVKSGGIKWCVSWYHPELKRFLILALPLMLGQSVVVLDEQFIRVFGSLAEDGSVSLLSYARRIMMVPVGVVAQAAGVASFPFLAGLIAKKDIQGFNTTLNFALSNSLIVVMPITFFMIIMAQATLGFLFEGGAFTSEFTARTTPLLQIMLLSVPFWVVQQIIGRAFYAMENTLTPALIGTLIALLSLPFYYIFAADPNLAPILSSEASSSSFMVGEMQSSVHMSKNTFAYGATGVAFITSFCVFLYAFTLYLFARKKFAKAFDGVFTLFIKNTLLSLLPALCIVFLLPTLTTWLNILGVSLLLSQALQISFSGLLFLVAYLLCAKIFMPQNITILATPFKRRFIKKSS